MKYLEVYKLFESRELKVEDIVYFSYYYSYSTDTFRDLMIYDNFITKYSRKIEDRLLIISDNESRKKMLNYAEKLLKVLSSDNEMKKEFIDVLNKTKEVYDGYPSLLELDDCLYSLIDEYPSIEYDFVISRSKKEIEVNLEVRKDLCAKLESENAFNALVLRFKNILNVDASYKVTHPKKMSNYMDSSVKYILIKKSS